MPKRNFKKELDTILKDISQLLAYNIFERLDLSGIKLKRLILKY